MSRRQITRICPEGWYYLFVVLFIIGGAVLGQVNLLVVLAGLTIAPLLFNWRLAQLMMRNLEIRRKIPPRVCAGDTLTVAVVGLNRRRRLTSWTVVVEDVLQREGGTSRETQRVRLILPRVPAQSSCSAAYRVLLTRRGRYQFGPLNSYTRFPFGLARSGMVVPERCTLLVAPRLGQLTQRWLQIVDSRLQGSHSEGRLQGMLEGDYYGLREWRPGDSQRWIHWRTSAKLGELAVRQFEQQRNRDLILVLDLWQPDSPTEQELLQTEIAVSFLATAVTDFAQRGGSHVVVSVAGRETRYWAGPASTMIAHDVLDHLAEAVPGDGLQIYRVLDQVRHLGRANARSVVISTRGAPFLTPADEWEATARPSRQPRAFGNLTWIDCGSELLRQYFRWQATAPGSQDRASVRLAARGGWTRHHG
jgi:uncharacterized protein (DUF58 family)